MSTSGAGQPNPQPGIGTLAETIKSLKLFQPEIGYLVTKVRSVENGYEEKEKALQQKSEELNRRQQQFEQEKQLERENLKKESDHHNYKMSWEREALKKEQEAFREAQKQGAEIADAQEPVTVEVGGEKFRTELRTLAKCTGSVFPMLVQGVMQKRQENGRNQRDPYIFIDRDGRHFRFILNYLRQGKQVMQGSAMRNQDKYTLNEILAEVQYYKISELWRLVKFKQVSLNGKQNFEALMRENRFKPIQIQGRNVKFTTTAEITFKGCNFTDIVFDKVHFCHPVKFENCVLTNARFIRCIFQAVLTFTTVDFDKATFDHCEGANVSHLFFQDTDVSSQQLFQPT